MFEGLPPIPSSRMSHLVHIPIHMRNYLAGSILDPALPQPILHWQLPQSLDVADGYPIQLDLAQGSWYRESQYLPQATAYGLYSQYKHTKTYSSRCCIHVACPFFYYEVLIKEVHLRDTTHVRMTVGLVWDDQNRSKHSYYYGDCFAQGTREHGIQAGDIIGCGISRPHHTIFYTKNGKHLGHSQYPAFNDAQMLLRPLVCIASLDYHTASRYQTPILFLTNFGQVGFAFDMVDLSTSFWVQRRDRFRRTAALLPPEILMLIATLLADEECTRIDPVSRWPWTSLSVVCRSWSKIFRPLIFQEIVLERMTQFRHFCHTIGFSDNGVGPLVKELDIRPTRHWKVDGAVGDVTPSLHLVLASLAWRFEHLTHLRWVAHDLQHPAPPRVHSALSALFHPLRSLKCLEIVNWTCKSAELLRIIRAIDCLEILSMVRARIEGIGRPLCWPASVLKCPPHLLELDNCRLSCHSLPVLLTLCLSGQPHMPVTTRHSPIASWSPQRPIHPDDINSIIDMYKALLRPFDACEQFDLEVDSLSDMSMSIITTIGHGPWIRMELNMRSLVQDYFRLERVELELELYPQRVMDSRVILNSLDMSLSESPGRSFTIDLCVDEYRVDTENLLPELMPKMHAAGRIFVIELESILSL